MADLRELIEWARSVEAKATQGPWRRCQANEGHCQCGLVWSISEDVPVVGTEDYPIGKGLEDIGVGRDEDTNNGALIAIAHNLLLPLLAVAQAAYDAEPDHDYKCGLRLPKIGKCTCGVDALDIAVNCLRDALEACRG